MRTIKIKRKVKSTLLKIKELEQFKGKDIELEIKVKELVNRKSKKKEKNLAGVFSKYANVNLIGNEKLAWELAVREKHENYRR
jgi:uncharacterized protein YajQ (UPF0234 family)